MTRHDTYTQAFQTRDATFDGVFYTGIKTTGIFCRPSCSARKAKVENCEHFASSQNALLAGYRACKTCHPLTHAHLANQAVVDAVEDTPTKRWKDSDFRGLGGSESRFKTHTAMSFVAFARARRLGLVFKDIRRGRSTAADLFADLMGPLKARMPTPTLHAQWIDTRLGAMIAIADEDGLCLLDYTDRRGLERQIECLRKRLNATIVPGETPATRQVADELTAYFSGSLTTFKTPLSLIGTDFQKAVWRALLDIPYGETSTYATQAQTLTKPEAIRTVGRANGANQLEIIVPCHRVLGSDGDLTGYGGGLERKRWLLDHEKGRLERTALSISGE